MSDMEQRTEEATPKRREEAREEGRIPKSPELTSAFLLLGSAGILSSMGPALAASVTSSVTYGLITAGSANLDDHGAVEMVRAVGWKVLTASASFVAAMAGVALAMSALQARGVFSFKPLEPKWERINPMTNAGQMFGARPWIELGKSLLKLGIVGMVVYRSIRASWPLNMALAQQSPRQLLTLLHTSSVGMLRSAGFAFLALALADYLYQVWQHEKGMRMSKQEVKQESKENDGDPLVKARMRSMGRALARRQMFREVPNADVVITNPTHIAVALKYDPKKADAPVVLAMGQRKIAQRIKQIARESGVPTVENRPLARALLASAKVGMMIPAELYVAVAEVLAFVFKQRRGSRVAGGAA